MTSLPLALAATTLLLFAGCTAPVQETWIQEDLGDGAKRTETQEIAGFLAEPGTGVVEGTVQMDGEPVVGALVVLAGTDNETTTNGDGWFAFPFLLAGPYLLEITKPGAEPFSRWIPVHEGKRVTLELDLERTEALSYQVSWKYSGYADATSKDDLGGIVSASTRCECAWRFNLDPGARGLVIQASLVRDGTALGPGETGFGLWLRHEGQTVGDAGQAGDLHWRTAWPDQRSWHEPYTLRVWPTYDLVALDLEYDVVVTAYYGSPPPRQGPSQEGA